MKLKTITLIFIVLSIGRLSLAQTNTFPNTGKVGIGTLNPTEQVSISGVANTSPGVISLESSKNDAVEIEKSISSNKEINLKNEK